MCYPRFYKYNFAYLPNKVNQSIKVTKETGLEEIQVHCLLAERWDSTHKTHIYELFRISAVKWQANDVKGTLQYVLQHIGKWRQSNNIKRPSYMYELVCQNTSFIECKCYNNQVYFFQSLFFNTNLIFSV